MAFTTAASGLQWQPRMRPPALSGLREADGGFDPWCAVAAALRRRHAFNTVARVSEAHPGPGRPGAPGVGGPSCVAAAPDAAFGLIRATRSSLRSPCGPGDRHAHRDEPW